MFYTTLEAQIIQPPELSRIGTGHVGHTKFEISERIHSRTYTFRLPTRQRPLSFVKRKKQRRCCLAWATAVLVLVEVQAMGKPRRSRAAPFSASQVEHLEKMISENKASVSVLLDRNVCQQLARQFNHSSGLAGNNVIQGYQVKEWFENKLTCLPAGDNENEIEIEIASHTCISDNALQEADERDKMPDLDKLEFEARSSRDFAWYDVGTFLAHRISNDQVEVKVRYADFGADEDEWINVKRAIRVRSVPVESSECTKVQVGDLVLCFREGSNEAVHYDAHVIEIERKQHDIRGCRCLFLIRYDHDETEEKVHLSRLCRRPKF